MNESQVPKHLKKSEGKKAKVNSTSDVVKKDDKTKIPLVSSDNEGKTKKDGVKQKSKTKKLTGEQVDKLLLEPLKAKAEGKKTEDHQWIAKKNIVKLLGGNKNNKEIQPKTESKIKKMLLPKDKKPTKKDDTKGKELLKHRSNSAVAQKETKILIKQRPQTTMAVPYKSPAKTNTRTILNPTMTKIMDKKKTGLHTLKHVLNVFGKAKSTENEKKKPKLEASSTIRSDKKRKSASKDIASQILNSLHKHLDQKYSMKNATSSSL